MKRHIYNRTRTFRIPNTLSAALDSIADASNRYTSEVIREAITRYVSLCHDNPDLLGRSSQ